MQNYFFFEPLNHASQCPYPPRSHAYLRLAEDSTFQGFLRAIEDDAGSFTQGKES